MRSATRVWGMCVAVLVFAASIGGTVAASASTGRGTVGARVSALGSLRAATLGVADEIPGTEWTELASGNTATFRGSLSIDPASPVATNDVLRAYFRAGEVVSFSMDAEAGTDFGLVLWGPDTLSVYSDLDAALADVAPSFYGGPEEYPVTIDSYLIPKSGYYYINPYTWYDDEDPANTADGGSGDYALTATIENAGTSVEISPVSTLGFGEAATVSGHVASRGSQEVTGTVWLMGSSDGVHYDPMDVQELGAGGTFSFDAPDNTTTMHYVVEYDGTDFYNPSSARITVSMLAYLTNPAASRYGARSYRLSGTLGSWHAAGSSAVRIYLWRYVSGKWKAYGYRLAKVAGSGWRSTFTATYKFPYVGKWRMQAYHSDANHATTRSGLVTFTVK